MKRIAKVIILIITILIGMDSCIIVCGCSPAEPTPYASDRSSLISRAWTLVNNKATVSDSVRAEWNNLKIMLSTLTTYNYQDSIKGGSYNVSFPSTVTLPEAERNKIWKSSGTWAFKDPTTQDGVNILYRDGNKNIPLVTTLYNYTNNSQLHITFILPAKESLTGKEEKWNFVFESLK